MGEMRAPDNTVDDRMVSQLSGPTDMPFFENRQHLRRNLTLDGYQVRTLHDHPDPDPALSGYDLEEKYALLYFRYKGTNWDEITSYFKELFPKGQPRRCLEPSIPIVRETKNTVVLYTLPDTYTSREKSGLQSRYYRMREEEGWPKLRDTARTGLEEEVLAEMVMTEKVGKDFANYVYNIVNQQMKMDGISGSRGEGE